MIGFVMFLHALLSLLLVVVILMQSGRGGGLTESFASAESMFGAQTNEFMIKATTVIASLFLITSLGLAILSAQKGKSLMAGTIASEDQIIIGDVPEMPVEAENAVTITDSEIEKQRTAAEAIPVETGAEETRGTAIDAVPFVTKPEVAPPVDTRQIDVPADPIVESQ